MHFLPHKTFAKLIFEYVHVHRSSHARETNKKGPLLHSATGSQKLRRIPLNPLNLKKVSTDEMCIADIPYILCSDCMFYHNL